MSETNFGSVTIRVNNPILEYENIDIPNTSFCGQAFIYHKGAEVARLNFIPNPEYENDNFESSKIRMGFDLSDKGDETVSLKKELSGYIHKHNCIAEGLKELQTKKQMLREQLIDAVNNAQNSGLCVDLIHDELKSFAHEFIIVCENLEIDCDEIPF
ncbi:MULTISPECIES: hypothetical protein [Proteus]|uniref:hypothetical protein n=1 Tax=Proteus TaxID=583 RepID=UPI000D68DB29|nr:MULTISPECIES: hypothetical protein [Proteus]MBI6405477.1 hypothetical protein [Proteus sp. PR00208]